MLLVLSILIVALQSAQHCQPPILPAAHAYVIVVQVCVCVCVEWESASMCVMCFMSQLSPPISGGVALIIRNCNPLARLMLVDESAPKVLLWWRGVRNTGNRQRFVQEAQAQSLFFSFFSPLLHRFEALICGYFSFNIVVCADFSMVQRIPGY